MLAFDIDGCMNYIKEDLFRIGEVYFQNFCIQYNPKGYYLKEMWCGAPEKAYSEFWEKYGYEIYTNPPRKDAVKLIKTIKELEISACYITTRDTTKEFSHVSMGEITQKWLIEYGIELPVYYCKHKEIVARELGVNLIVEDKPDNIEKLQKVTNVLIFDHPYNEAMEGNHIKRWDEISAYL
jgi:uncharacterized HAD superfamily protein